LSLHGLRRRPRAHPVGFGLKHPVLHHRDPAAGCADATLALLDHVGELMAQELLALYRSGLVAARGEVDVVAHGEGNRADSRCLGPGVHPDRGEVCPERGLHLGEHGLGKRLTAAVGEAELDGVDLEAAGASPRLGD
jgi:hypothetical protein